MDGTLLDHESYSYEASLPAIRKLRAHEVPLVLCSSKTRSEILVLWTELGLRDPFISENGGAIFFPPQHFSFPVEGARAQGALAVLELGTEIATLRRALAEAGRAASVSVRSFGSMTPDEVARLTGLAPEQAVLARQREYDEPFVVEAGDAENLITRLRDLGFTVIHGGRLFHLVRGHDKGQAVRRLLDLYRRREPGIVSVGLGNSANDLPLLREVNYPVAVKNIDGSHDREILRALPQVDRTERVGPAGWREAVEKFFPEAGNFS